MTATADFQLTYASGRAKQRTTKPSQSPCVIAIRHRHALTAPDDSRVRVDSLSFWRDHGSYDRVSRTQGACKRRASSPPRHAPSKTAMRTTRTTRTARSTRTQTVLTTKTTTTVTRQTSSMRRGGAESAAMAIAGNQTGPDDGSVPHFVALAMKLDAPAMKKWLDAQNEFSKLEQPRLWMEVQRNVVDMYPPIHDFVERARQAGKEPRRVWSALASMYQSCGPSFCQDGESPIHLPRSPAHPWSMSHRARPGRSAVLRPTRVPGCQDKPTLLDLVRHGMRAAAQAPTPAFNLHDHFQLAGAVLTAACAVQDAAATSVEVGSFAGHTLLFTAAVLQRLGVRGGSGRVHGVEPFYRGSTLNSTPAELRGRVHLHATFARKMHAWARGRRLRFFFEDGDHT